MGFCWFTSTWFGKQRSRSQWLSGQNNGQAVEADTDWKGTPIPPKPSGSSIPERHFHSPKTFWLFSPRKGLCSLTYTDLKIQGTNTGSKNHHWNGKCWLWKESRGERVGQRPAGCGWEMLWASPASTSPSQTLWGWALHQAQPWAGSPFFTGITSKCLLGLLGAWCEFAGSFPRTINTRSILLYSVLFVLLIWY